MRAFDYWSPTEVVFGEGTASSAAKMVAKYQGTRVFVVYGGGSVVRSGLLESICKQMEAAGIAYETLGGVQPNPRLGLTREGVAKASAFGANFFLAVGGGSVIDCTKAIAIGVANPEIDLWEFWMDRAVVTKSLPVGVVLTIPAAGSETSDASVLTNEETEDKRAVGTSHNRPKFAIMDPVLAMSLPKYQMGLGVTDIMMHTMDRYFNPVTSNQLTDMLALGLLKVVVENGVKLVENPDVETMSEIMWAGSVSHNGLTGLGCDCDFAPHQLGHALSALYDLSHGATLAAVWPSWARYCYKTDPKRFADYGKFVFGVDASLSDEDAALAAIDATEQYFLSLGMPVDFAAAKGVGKKEQADFEALAMQCSFSKERTIGTYQVLDFDDMVAIYKMANEKA